MLVKKFICSVTHLKMVFMWIFLFKKKLTLSWVKFSYYLGFPVAFYV